MQTRLSTYRFGSIDVIYLHDEESAHVSLVLLPAGTSPRYNARRGWLGLQELIKIGMDERAWTVGSLCHLSLRHHSQSKGAGATLKYGQSTNFLKFTRQDVLKKADQTTIETVLAADEGYEIVHRLTYTDGDCGVEVQTEFINHTGNRVSLDLLTSFALDNLSPLQLYDAANCLRLHRFRGGWSLEGKHCAEDIEALNLERSWLCAFPDSERFGCIGSHPVKRFFPLCALEDKEHHILWGAQLAINSSWQMELSRDSDCYSLSGGIADCEFGAWMKTVPNGESFVAPKAFLTVATNSIDEVCSNLTQMHQKYADRQPLSEQDLPILYNEYCLSWGNPSHDQILAIAKKMQGTPVRVITVDAGWTKVAKNSYGQGGNGDWIYDEEKFPDGLLDTSLQLYKLGFQLGIWFEFEVTTTGARVFEKEYDHLHLKRGKEVIVTGGDRSFWDFRNSETIAFLKARVLTFLKSNQIRYLKVDYNGSIGIGCDGAESLGEGLRIQMQAVYDFFVLLRDELPDLVIENCASGGHRLEPMMMDITAMSSFSDAHECIEIPVIAANLHRLILPRQNQIWAVLNPEYDLKTFYYRLCSTFLGRMCLSGDLAALDTARWMIVLRAMEFYDVCKDIIKCGRSRIYGERPKNTRHPSGAQAVFRMHEANHRALMVCHRFALSSVSRIEIELPSPSWELTDFFGFIHPVTIDQGRLIIDINEMDEFECFACIVSDREQRVTA